jgi:hypothetical protein
MTTSGFYRFLDDTLHFGTKIYAPNFTLLADDHESYAYPVDGWYWFDTIQEAEAHFKLNGAVTSRWLEFGAALAQDPTMNMFFRELDEHATILYGMLTVGMGQASEGKPRTFLAAWGLATANGLIPPELQAHLVTLASGYELPAEFMTGLQPWPSTSSSPSSSWASPKP